MSIDLPGGLPPSHEDLNRSLVELEAENAYLRSIIRMARQRLYDAHGRGPETVAQVIRAVGKILRRGEVEEESEVDDARTKAE